MVPLAARIATALGHWLGESFGGNLRLAPDLDEVPALGLEREALWKRVGEAAFLTDDEKRAATGYEPLPAASFAPSSIAALRAKYDPNQPRVPAGNPDGGQWTSGGGSAAGEEDDNELLPSGAQPTSSEKERLITANDQPPRDDLLSMEALANDPYVRNQIENAWKASNAGHYFATQEHGFWIVRDPVTGQLYTKPFAGLGTPFSIAPGPKPEDAIAFFHTHPNTGNALAGPSITDGIFAGIIGLPGFIRSQNGMYYFGPEFRP